MAEEPPGGGGGGLSRKIGPIPVWGWAVGIGGLIGLWWALRKRASSSTPMPVDTSADATDTTGDTTSLIPIDQGMSDNQFRQLLAAIQALQGPPSQPVDGGGTNGGGGTTLPVTTYPQPVPKPTLPVGQIKPMPSPVPAGTATSTPKSVKVSVPSGSGWSWSSIAAQYGHTWRDLWNYNTTPGVRSASSEAKLKSEGVDHSLFGGTTVYVPASWKKVK